MKIFISYRRDDSAGHTGRLYDSLEEHFGAESLFMDLNAIESGQNFIEEITTAIGSCDVLIAVIGNQWLTCAGPRGRRLDDPHDFVRAEIAAALERGTPVIPVLVEGAAMPAAEVLPGPLQSLASRHAHELSDHRWSYDVRRLVQATEKLAGTRRRLSRRQWVSLAILLAVALMLGSALWIRWLPIATGPEDAASVPGPDRRLAGEWAAVVTYYQGTTHTERFTFRVDGSEVRGTASYLGRNRGIVDGALNGDTVVFSTRTQLCYGDCSDPVDVVHRYRGTIAGDRVTFDYTQTEDGTPAGQWEFTATRVSGSDPSPLPE